MTDQDEDRAKHRPCNVYAVADKQVSSDNAALQRHVDELQEALEQVTKGIVALATRPVSGMTAQPNATAAVGSGQGASGKKSSGPKKGAHHGKPGCGGAGGYRRPNPKTNPCKLCNQMGHWAKDFDQAKKPAAEEAASTKMVQCQLVSPTKIYVTATIGISARL